VAAAVPVLVAVAVAVAVLGVRRGGSPTRETLAEVVGHRRPSHVEAVE